MINIKTNKELVNYFKKNNIDDPEKIGMILAKSGKTPENAIDVIYGCYKNIFQKNVKKSIMCVKSYDKICLKYNLTTIL